MGSARSARRPKWHEDPDGQPRHRHYWLIVTLALASIAWPVVDLIRDLAAGGPQAGVGWHIGEYLVWQAAVTACIVFAWDPSRRAPNLLRGARIAAAVPFICIPFLSPAAAFAFAHPKLSLASGVWAVVNLVLSFSVPPRPANDPYQDVIKP